MRTALTSRWIKNFCVVSDAFGLRLNPDNASMIMMKQEKCMGTRSQIGYINSETIQSIYCHYDGYVVGVGDTLIRYYSDDSIMRALIVLGSIRSLQRDLANMPEEAFDPKFASRDINTSKDIVEFLDYARYNGTEYAYLWTGEYFDAWQYDYRATEWVPIDIYAIEDTE